MKKTPSQPGTNPVVHLSDTSKRFKPSETPKNVFKVF